MPIVVVVALAAMLAADVPDMQVVGACPDAGDVRRLLLQVLTADEVRERSVASFRRRVQRMTGHRDEPKEKIVREVTIPETITIQELANRIGTTRETVTRMLKDLERQGLVKVEGRELVLQPGFERAFD